MHRAVTSKTAAMFSGECPSSSTARTAISLVLTFRSFSVRIAELSSSRRFMIGVEDMGSISFVTVASFCGHYFCASLYRDVMNELRTHVCRRLDQFMEAGVSGADFYIAAIGVSCEVYGQYERVVRDDDGRQVTISEMLSDIRGICSDHIVKTLTTGDAGDIDAMSKLYISWRWAYGDRPVPYDVARKLFTGVGLNIDDHAGTILKKSGQDMTMLDHLRRGKDIRTKNAIDILHKALQLWRDQKSDDVDELLASTGNLNNPRFNQTIQAIIEAGAARPGAHPETAERRDPRGVPVREKVGCGGRSSGELRRLRVVIC